MISFLGIKLKNIYSNQNDHDDQNEKLIRELSQKLNSDDDEESIGILEVLEDFTNEYEDD